MYRRHKKGVSGLFVQSWLELYVSWVISVLPTEDTDMAKVSSLSVNGRKLPVNVDSQTGLLTVLRDFLNLTGTKYGCGEAQCGACTVLVDGHMTRSCTMPVGKVAGKQITTIEGLDKDGQLHPLQQAFIEADAMQCGYCTSGMIMSGVALLKKNAKPSRDEIVKHMDRNVCRCGTYLRIVKAIEIASGTSGEVRK
jgi:nicotinate dehydrogenase subunit A